MSGGYVKERAEAFSAFGCVGKGGSRGSRLLPVGLTGGSQRDTKTSVKPGRGLGALVYKPRGFGKGLGSGLPQSPRDAVFWVGTRVRAVGRNDPYVPGQLFVLNKS